MIKKMMLWLCILGAVAFFWWAMMELLVFFLYS